MNDRDRARVKRYRNTAKGKEMRLRQRQAGRQAERRRQTALRREARDFINGIKSKPCADCGGTFDPVCMDFDHRPGEVKLFPIAKGAELFYRKKTTSRMSLLLAEIAKCDIVCANCHRLRTYRQRDHAAVCAAGRGLAAETDATPQLDLPITEGAPN